MRSRVALLVLLTLFACEPKGTDRTASSLTPTALCSSQRSAHVSYDSTLDGETLTTSPGRTTGPSSDSGATPHQRPGSAAGPPAAARAASRR